MSAPVFKFNPFTDKLDITGPGGGGTGFVQTLTGDTGGAIPPTAGNINILGKPDLLLAGNAGTSTLQGTNLTKLTPYVVGPINQYAYQTIQSALNAANTAGGGLVFVTPGTYTENLTLFDNTLVIGSLGFADTGSGATIIGVHTPPLTGSFIFRNVLLQSATHIFSSNAAGSSHLIIGDAAIIVTNGFTFNLPNWSGKLELFDVNDRGSTNDGMVNNSGGAPIAFFTSAIGAGTLNTLTSNGVVSIFTCAVSCPCNFGTGSNVFLEGNVHTQTITFSGNSIGEITYSELDASGPVVVMNSSGSLLLSETVINTTNNPAISGTGSGILTIGEVSYVGNANIAGTVTLSKGVVESGIAYLNNLSFDRGTTTLTLNGQLVIGKTGVNPKIGSLTSPNNSILIGYSDPNITLTTNGSMVGNTITGNSGGALSPTAGNWNILGAGAVSTSGSGSTLTINITGGGFAWIDVTTATQTLAINTGYVTNRVAGVTYTLPATATEGDMIRIAGKSGAWSIAQNANQQINVGSASSTVGVGGSVASTNAGDCIELLCTTSGASTVWRALSYVGNLTVT